MTCSFALIACAHTAGEIGQEIAAEATPAAIEHALQTFDEEENRDRIVRILSAPEVEDAARELTARLMDGTLATMSDSKRLERIAEATSAFIAKASKAVADQMHHTISPEIARAVSLALDASLQKVLSDGNQAKIGDAVGIIAARAVQALIASVRTELRAILREDLGPALREILREEQTQQELSKTGRVVVKQMVLGMQDAFEEIDARHARGRGRDTVLTHLQDLIGQSGTAMTAVIILLALGAMAAAGAAVWSWARARTALAESEKRDSALFALLEAVRKSEDAPWSAELIAQIEESLRQTGKTPSIRDFFSKRGRDHRSKETDPVDRKDR